MNKYDFSLIFSTALFPATAVAGNNAVLKIREKPNIILIYVDDLGYSDPGCYGKVFGNNFTETPHIDRLAREGVCFTDAYAAAPISSASRAGLLTGQYPARLGFEFVTGYERNARSWESDAWKKKFKGKKLLPPPLKMHLPLEETTLAEMMQNNGYQTAMAGKWHVASNVNRFEDWNPYYGPKQRGFDWTADTYGAHPLNFIDKKEEEISKDDYPYDELTAQAIDFLNGKHDKPFFLYVSHYFVHTPVDVRTEKLIEKYRKKAAGSQTEEKIHYAAFLEQLDHYIGQLLDAIDAAGLTERTLVLFSSDNGGDPIYSFNRPFRGSKWNLYEGGVRVPFIVRWPSHVLPGTTSNQLITQLDIMPTLYELCCARNDRYEQQFDGISMLSCLQNKKTVGKKDRTLIWHFPYYHPEGEPYENAPVTIGTEDGYVSRTKPHSSIRKGNWKLIRFYEDGNSELYNLENDPGEKTDISFKEKRKKAQLEKELLFLLKGMNARFPRRQ